MKASEARILRSEGRGLFWASNFVKLGDPGLRSADWCHEAVRILVDEAYWAPEIHWAPSDEVRLEFRRAGNAEWALSAAIRAGMSAQHFADRQLVLVALDSESTLV